MTWLLLTIAVVGVFALLVLRERRRVAARMAGDSTPHRRLSVALTARSSLA